MSLEMSNKLFILASSEGIGGAESRTIKYAHYAAKTYERDVVLLINKNLHDRIRDNQLLSGLIKVKNLTLNIYEPSRYKYFSEAVRNILLKNPRFKKLLPFIPKFFIKQLSWFPTLKKVVNEGDSLHCIFGDTARIGTYFFSQSKYGVKIPSIVEITSNRHVETWGCHLNYCFSKEGLPSNLFVKCVSDTVFQNLIPYVRPCILNNTSAYPGPFIIIPKEKAVQKENIILFAHRFIPPKNPLLFAQAIVEMHDENKLNGWKIHIRGNGSLEPEIRKKMKGLLKSNVVEIGYSTDLINESKKSKIFVSIIETGNYPSQSLFECMRYGSILVLSNRGVTKEKIGNNEAIHYVEDLSVSEIKNSLFKAIMQADSSGFEQLSKSIEVRYEEIASNSGYLETVNGIYQNGQ